LISALVPADPASASDADPPGATRFEIVSMRSRDAKHFRNPDGSYTGVFRDHMHYLDDVGEWQDVDLNFRAAPGGYTADRNDVVVNVGGDAVSAIDRHTGIGIRWYAPTAPTVSGRRARFSGQGLQWTYETRVSGLKLSAMVHSAQGLQTYAFDYELIGGIPLLVDADGNLVGAGFTVPRAVAFGADRQVYRAGAWQLLDAGRVAFTFDDSSLPTSAYPYELDPTTTFSMSTSGDDGYVAGGGSSYPPSWNTTSTGNSYIHTERSKLSTTYFIANALLRWNTSSIPDDARLSSTSPQVTLYVTNQINTNSRSLTADWYSSWPIDATDYSTTAQTSALSAQSLSTFGINTTNWVNLGNHNGVSQTSYTGLRLHVSGGSPTGDNYLEFRSYDWGAGAPQLTVDYFLNAAPTIVSATDSPDPVTVGSSVTFSVGWNEPDPGDFVKAVVCKTNSVSASATCPGGTWGTGGYGTTSPSTASYTATAANVGTQSYYAFACDDSNACSSSVAGTFTVRPRIDSVSAAPNPVLAGGAVTFNVAYTSGTNVKAAICKTNAVNADATCPGGMWATSGTYSSNNPATASYTTTTADVGTKSYYAFVCTSGGVCSAGTFATFQVLQWLSPASEVVFTTPVAQGPVGTTTILTFEALRFDGTPFVGPVRYGVGPASGGIPAATQTIDLTATNFGHGQIPVAITNAGQVVIAYADRTSEGANNVRDDTEVPGSSVVIGIAVGGEPNVPTLVSPAAGYQFPDGAVQVFTINAVDPDADTFADDDDYRGLIVIRNTSGNPVAAFVTSSADSGEDVAGAPVVRVPGGSYTWTARAIDERGTPGPESTPRSFTVATGVIGGSYSNTCDDGTTLMDGTIESNYMKIKLKQVGAELWACVRFDRSSPAIHTGGRLRIGGSGGGGSPSPTVDTNDAYCASQPGNVNEINTQVGPTNTPVRIDHFDNTTEAGFCLRAGDVRVRVSSTRTTGLPVTYEADPPT
jgi:hypothetical protein